MKYVFFDLDGTLIDSQKTILASLQSAMVQSGSPWDSIPLAPEIIGPPILQILKNLLPFRSDTEYEGVISYFRKSYDGNPVCQLSVYSGIPKILDWLMQHGYVLFIVTNKPSLPTEKILQFLNWNFFKAVMSPNSLTNHQLSKTECILHIIKEFSLNFENCIFVGDTHADISAAHNAGIQAIGALWGYGEAESIKKEAEFAAESPEQLISIMSQLKGVYCD